MGSSQSILEAKITEECADGDVMWSTDQRKQTISKLVKLHDKVLAETGKQEKALEVVKKEYIKIKQQALLPKKVSKQLSEVGKEMMQEIFRYK